MSQTAKNRRFSPRWRRVVFAGGILLLGLAAFMTRRGAAPSDTAQVMKPVQEAQPVRLRLVSKLLDSRTATPAWTEIWEQGAEAGPGLISDARPRMLKTHPELAEFRTLERKVLRSDEDKARRDQILSDPELIRHSRDRLLAERDGPLTREDELERLYRVEYLAASIENQENSALDVALDVIQEIILAENIRSTHSVELQRSLAGDKMELYLALLHDAPEQAALLAKAAEGTSTEALIAYAQHKYHVWTSPETGDPQ